VVLALVNRYELGEREEHEHADDDENDHEFGEGEATHSLALLSLGTCLYIQVELT